MLRMPTPAPEAGSKEAKARELSSMVASAELAFSVSIPTEVPYLIFGRRCELENLTMSMTRLYSYFHYMDLILNLPNLILAASRRAISLSKCQKMKMTDPKQSRAIRAKCFACIPLSNRNRITTYCS